MVLNGGGSEQVPGCVPGEAEEESDSVFYPRRRQRSPVGARVPRSRPSFDTTLLCHPRLTDTLTELPECRQSGGTVIVEG